MATRFCFEKYTVVLALTGMTGCSSVGVDDGGEINEYKTGVFVACVNSHDSETDTDNYTWEYELTPTGGPENTTGDDFVCKDGECIRKDYSNPVVCAPKTWFPAPGSPSLWYNDLQSEEDLQALVADRCALTCIADNYNGMNLKPWGVQNYCTAPWAGYEWPSSGFLADKGYPGWTATDGANCNPFASGFDAMNNDSNASSIQWPPLGASEPLVCSLAEDCCLDFDAPICEYLSIPALSPPPFESGAADYTSWDNSGTQLALDMPGTGSGVDDTNALEGAAEFSAADCGETTCPFYLANLKAYNYTDAWNITAQVETFVGTVSLSKDVSNVEFELAQPVLGMWRPSTGDVAFLAGTVFIRTEFDLGTCTGAGCSSAGNGHYAATMPADTVIFGSFDDGEFSLTHSFDVQGGTGTLTVDLSPTEHPPIAQISVPTTTVACDGPDGYSVPGGADQSSDSDNDLSATYWKLDNEWVDGLPIVPLGVHTLSLFAIDERSAVNRAELTLTVTSETPCL